MHLLALSLLHKTQKKFIIKCFKKINKKHNTQFYNPNNVWTKYTKFDRHSIHSALQSVSFLCLARSVLVLMYFNSFWLNFDSWRINTWPKQSNNNKNDFQVCIISKHHYFYSKHCLLIASHHNIQKWRAKTKKKDQILSKGLVIFKCYLRHIGMPSI